MAVGDLRIVSYNIHSADTPPASDLGLVLQAIGNEVVASRARPIDILTLQEVDTQATTTAQVVNQLNAIYGAGTYQRGTLNGAASSGSDTVGVVFNTQTVELLSEIALGVPSTSGQPRQTMRYKFHPIGLASDEDFYVYNSHFKAGTAPASENVPSDEARRAVEAQVIRADADALGPGVSIIYAGDFNTQASSEPAFQTLLSNGHGQASDPLNRPGSWHNNGSFVAVMTQATTQSPPPGLTGGGLDDRFDFQLLSGEWVDGSGLEYRTGSYRAFGNNGSVGLNGSINDSSNTALTGLANRLDVLNLLTTVSDHLPVVVDYEFVAALRVLQFAPTESGFSVLFDRPLATAELNILATPSTAGPVDVTFAGAATGPVAGALVVSEEDRRITFVKAGGPLASDVYVVTLRSAVNGFKGTSGQLLDGNGDAIGGDDYSANFSVPSRPPAEVLISVPDFARGPDQAVNLPTENSPGIPLTLSMGLDVTRVDFDVLFQPTLLTIHGFTCTIAGASVAFQGLAPGMARVTVSSPSQFSSSAGSIELGRLAASVPGTAAYGAQQLLDLANVSVKNGASQPRPSRDDDGVHMAAFVGDVNASQTYTSGDVTLLQRMIVGADAGFAAFPLSHPALLADINRNGAVTAGDVTLLQRVLIGVPVAQVPPLPARGTSPPAALELSMIFHTLEPQQISGRDRQLVGVRGLPSQAEVTDAAINARAECVMPTQGPHTLEAIKTLDNIFGGMQDRRLRKRPLLQPLGLANDLQPLAFEE